MSAVTTDFWGESPPEAKEGPYKIGAMIMVSRDGLGADYRLPDLPEWFPARVCYPDPGHGNNYRWYDPFIWYETEGPIHKPSESQADNHGYVGKLWYNGRSDFWACPIEVWRDLQAVLA